MCGEVEVGVEDIIAVLQIILGEAAPELRSGNSVCDISSADRDYSVELLTLVNSCDETKVSRTTLLSLPQIRVLLGVGLHNGAVRKDNFPILNHVACQSVRIAVKRILLPLAPSRYTTSAKLTPPPVVKPPTPTTDVLAPTTVTLY